MTSPFANSPVLTPWLADLRARFLVNGAERHSKSGEMEPVTGAWAPRFRDHPWVIQSDAEGWGRELRAVCIHAARQRIMAGIKPNDIEINDLMPDRGWVDYTRSEAARTASATKWREENPNHPSIRGNVAFDVEGMLRRFQRAAVDPDTGEVR